jgi:hypothetical protein
MYANNAAINRNDVQGVVLTNPDLEAMLVADEIAPFLGKPEQHFRYPVLNAAQGGRLRGAGNATHDETLINPGDGYARVTESLVYATDSCIKRGLEYPVADVDQIQLNGKSGFDLEVHAASSLTRRMLIAREQRVSSLLTSASNGITRTNAGTKWLAANIATATVVDDILAAIERLTDKGYIPNAIILPFVRLNIAKRSTQFLNYGKQFGIKLSGGGDSTSSVTNSDFLAAFAEHGIEKLIICRAAAQVNNEGTDTVTTAKLWNQDFAMVARLGDGELENGGLARTIYWDEAESVPYQVQTYRDEPKESDIVRVKQFDRERIIDAAAGELILANY